MTNIFMISPPFRFPFSQHPARLYIIFCRFRFPGFRQSGKPFRDFNQKRRTDTNTLSHIPAKNRTSMTITLPFLLLSENFHTYTCKFFKIGRSPPTPFYVPADIHRRPVLNRRAIRWYLPGNPAETKFSSNPDNTRVFQTVWNVRWPAGYRFFSLPSFRHRTPIHSAFFGPENTFPMQAICSSNSFLRPCITFRFMCFHHLHHSRILATGKISVCFRSKQTVSRADMKLVRKTAFCPSPTAAFTSRITWWANRHAYACRLA